MVQPNVSIIRYSNLPEAARFSRPHLARLMREGKFPLPVRLSVRKIGWREADIEAWLANRPTVEPGEPRQHSLEARAKMREAWVRRRGANAEVTA